MTSTRNLFNADECLADFFTRGFYVFSGEEIMQHILIDQFKVVDVKHPDNCFHAEGHEFHSETQADYIEALRVYIAKKWLVLLDTCELQFDFYSDKCNEHVTRFHSDAQYAMPGQNATVNCFFDDMNEEVGGRFDMAPFSKWNIGTKEAVDGMYSVHPRKFDIILFNQNRNFLHKANHASVPRRMISYACSFKNINPIMQNWTPG